MFKNFSLQTRMLAAFLFMGLLVLIIAIVGWSGNSRLSGHIDTLSKDTLPSVIGLWKINEGQTQVQSSERALLNTLLSPDKKQKELSRIKEAQEQINTGFKEYQSIPQSDGEKGIYDNFFRYWSIWKTDHEQLMRLYQQFAQLGIQDPPNRMAELVSQGKQNTPEMVTAKTADTLLDKISSFAANEELISFNNSTDATLELIKYNEEFGMAAKNNAEKDVTQTTFWVVVGMFIGPITAVIFGIFFSITIARPLGAKIASIVNAIASSSAQIAATVNEQERTASQQATAVNQTTTTMDELAASSRATAEQAEAAATGAKQVLNLVDSSAETQNNKYGSSLREKVGQIAHQVVRLSEQINQIGNISNLVSDLASQTNMLALNASVEAVRAGEHGRGFAVVAAEIRKLADQSRKSAEKIGGLVTDIQNTTHSTVMVTDEGTKTVENIVEAVSNIVVNSQQISLTSKQQSIAVQQVVEAMNSINQGALETATGITQTKAGTQKLNEAASNLRAIV